MKNFYAKFVTSYVLLVLAVSGCAALDRHSAIVSLAVSQATMRYIESKPEGERSAVASRVARVADDVAKVASGKPITIAELAELALSAIPDNLNPSDRELALAIVQVAAQELQNKVGENILTAEQTVTVREILDAVKIATSAYTPRVSS